jgi:hypothetical protein
MSNRHRLSIDRKLPLHGDAAARSGTEPAGRRLPAEVEQQVSKLEQQRTS